MAAAWATDIPFEMMVGAKVLLTLTAGVAGRIAGSGTVEANTVVVVAEETGVEEAGVAGAGLHSVLTGCTGEEIIGEVTIIATASAVAASTASSTATVTAFAVLTGEAGRERMKSGDS